MALLMLMVQRCKQGPPLSIVPLHSVLSLSVTCSDQTQPETYRHCAIEERSSVGLSILLTAS